MFLRLSNQCTLTDTRLLSHIHLVRRLAMNAKEAPNNSSGIFNILHFATNDKFL